MANNHPTQKPTTPSCHPTSCADDQPDPAQRVYAQYKQLAEAQQIVLRLSVLDGLAHAALAAKIGISPSGAARRLHRASKQLQASLAEQADLSLTQHELYDLLKSAIVRYGTNLT